MFLSIDVRKRTVHQNLHKNMTIFALNEHLLWLKFGEYPI